MENIIDINKLENRVHQSDGSWQAACPECRRNGRDKTGVHLRVWPTKQFNCIVAGKDKVHNSNILKLVGTIPSDEILETYYQEPEPKIKREQSWDISMLNSLVKNYDYWINRGVSPETCEHFKVGVAIKGQLNGRSVIPIFDPLMQNKINGFSGRMMNYTQWHKDNKVGKWKHLGNSSKFLWPHQKQIRYNKKLLIESPGCALKLFEHEIDNVKCLFGTVISNTVMGYLIAQNPDEILVGTNNELDSANKGVGNHAAEKIKKQLLQFFDESKIKIALPYRKDFGDMSGEEIKAYKEQWKL